MAGTAAGLIGSAGGITSLVSYPALLAVGLPALPASVANNVALVGCWPGSALGSRPELHGKAPWLWRWLGLAAAGGAAGAALLLSTPSGVFARIVPFLVAAASLVLLLEPRLRARRERRGSQDHRLALPAGLAAMSSTTATSAPDAGVMILTLLLLLVDGHLPTANALKNMLLGAATLVSAVVFALWGQSTGQRPPHWPSGCSRGAGLGRSSPGDSQPACCAG